VSDGWIEPDVYRSIVHRIPVACVDLIVRVPDGRYFLVKRRNEPLRDEWYLVGGRILLGESAPQAAVRKLFEEAGIRAGVEDFAFAGYAEDVFDKDPFADKRPYHTVSFVFSIDLGDELDPTLDDQSSAWGLFEELPARLAVIPPQESVREPS
jgi:colanic acid biosynthesis protein WcaH